MDREPLSSLVRDAPVRIATEATLRDAMSLLAARDAETAVVMEGDEVVGVFSLRRLGDSVNKQRFPKGSDQVEGWVSPPAYFRPDEPFENLVRGLARHGAVLIGDQFNVTAVITLRAVADFAHPFLVIEAIEGALRTAITSLVPPDERGPLFAMALRPAEGRQVPNSVEQLTIAEYRSVLTHPSLKERVRPVFGGSLGPRLEKVGDLRNRLLHFRDPLSQSDIAYLEDQRRYLHDRLGRLGAFRPPVPGQGA